MSDSTLLRQSVLDIIQSGFPLESHPYDVLADQLGVRTGDVKAAVKTLRSEGTIRRIGASFASAKMGFASILCALAVEGDEREVDRIANLVSAHGEITHNYLRNDRYNLWFTAIARDRNALDEVISDIIAETGCNDSLALPAITIYKIRVDFSGSAGRRDDRANATGKPFDASSPFDVALVRWGQGDATGDEPFADAARAVAAELDDPTVSEMHILARLRSWKASGVLRRFGSMVQHRNIGFLFNGMCVLDVPPDRIDELGYALAELPFVSHCYARPRSDRWPYNLYATAHAKTQEELDGHIEAVRNLTGLTPKVLVSTKEYKKASPVYFPPDAVQ